MTEPIQTLYEYARKTRIPTFLTGGEYESASEIVTRQEERLAVLLPADGKQVWEDFQGDSDLLQSMELEAAFQAGLSLGLELSRL